MKVLQINSVCGVGSTGRIVTDLYKILEEEGHECIIAYGRGKAPNGIKSIKIGSNFDNYMHAAKTRIFDKHGFGSTKATKEFIIKVKEYNPDVIHLHNIHGYYINIEILFDYLKKSNKKIIWTLHDCWSFTGHCSHFDYIKCYKWEKGGCEKCPQKNQYPSSIFKDNSKWNYENKKQIFTNVKNMTIVTPSKWLSRLVEKSFLNKYNIKVINNGIDLEIFRPTYGGFREKYNLKDKKIVLGVANIWTEKKGFGYFIELSKRLDSSFSIVMIGVNKRQKSMLPDNILGIIKTDNPKELAEIYSTADVFINPTLEDNLPTINLEASACGTNVITFDTGGCSETLIDNNGVIVEKGNLDMLEKSIYEVLNRNINKKYVSREFDKMDKYYKYLKIY